MFLWTQTALKDLEKPSTCPKRWQGSWLEGSVPPFPTNDYMLRGVFFESLAIGGGAKEQLVLDLPRLRNGNKSANQIRLEEQAEEFCRLFNPAHEQFLGYTIVQTQLYLEAGDRAGTLDFIAIDQDNNPCLFDLKSTGNLKRGWWSDIDSVDKLQQYHYHDLYLKTFKLPPGKRLRNFLAIFDYSVQKNILILELDVTETRLADMNDRFETAKEVVELYNKNGWTTDPSEAECEGCPLKCSNRFKIDKDETDKNN